MLKFYEWYKFIVKNNRIAILIEDKEFDNITKLNRNYDDR